jgi:hypothetical protein
MKQPASTKFQAPKSKQIRMTKIPNFKQDRLGHLKLEFGIWDLKNTLELLSKSL